MKTIKQLKTKWSILCFIFGSTISSHAQVVEGFESNCTNPANAFYTGCIPNWISASGTPDNLSNQNFNAFEGSKYAHMYASYKSSCSPIKSRSESIVLNYNFQIGTTYKITFAARGDNSSLISAPYTVISKWILTNGLTNKTGGSCATGEECQTIPPGSQPLLPINSDLNSWTVNQQVFTASANFSQLWCYAKVTSTTINGDRTINLSIDAVKIEIICSPTPSITSPNVYCENTPISLTGSSNCNITNNVWTVVESDQSGTPILGANEWWSPWATGAPGNFTIPTAANGGPTMQCGKYYRVKLVVQTADLPWTETTKVIFINCAPKINLKGSSNSICSGDYANLLANLVGGANLANYSLNWTPINPAGSAIYNGSFASVVSSPTVTTTYMATVTDNITGCSTSQTITVNVTNNDPSFSLNVNTSANANFTLSALANNQNTASIPGFGYAWFVEELDANNNAIFTFTNPSCWWIPLTTPTVFNGIDCVTNTYSGASTIANCTIPTIGKFLYGHKYRITRAVWSNACPWNQSSITVTPVKTQNGIELVEDHTAPDFSGSLTTGNLTIDNSISVYPNPSEGIFTIDLEDMENAQIEIYSVFGQKVKTINQKQTKETLDLTGFSKGIYWLKITSNGVEKRSKIILE